MNSSGSTFQDTELGPTLAPPAETLTERNTVLPRLTLEPGLPPRLVSDDRPRYETLSHVGEGGLGVVVSARDQDIGRRVAIKRIRPDRQTQGAFLRFVQEVRTGGRLDHPNIVPIHDVGRDPGGSYYFVMKYVEGETLESLITRLRTGDPATHAAWGWERRLALFVQMLHAVEFAHRHGIVHRDLKPANVMIGRHGEVQLLDWGVAKQLDQPDTVADLAASDPDTSRSVTRTQAGALIGTPKYMSPEQARGLPADVQVDTWALSMILLELLTLTHPFEDLQTTEALVAGIQTHPIPKPWQMAGHSGQGPVPADLGWIASDGLARDPAARYRTAAQLLTRIERRNEGDFPVQCASTFQKKMLRRATRFVDRRPVLAIVAMVAATAAAVGGLALVVVGSLSIAVGALGFAALS